MTEIKKLADNEYEILKYVQDGTMPDPSSSIALIAVDGCDVVGRMLLISPAHIEGTWVKEEFRNGNTGIRLMRKMEEEASNIGLSKIFSYAETDQIENYLERLGYTRCKVSVWSKEL